MHHFTMIVVADVCSLVVATRPPATKPPPPPPPPVKKVVLRLNISLNYYFYTFNTAFLA